MGAFETRPPRATRATPLKTIQRSILDFIDARGKLQNTALVIAVVAAVIIGVQYLNVKSERLSVSSSGKEFLSSDACDSHRLKEAYVTALPGVPAETLLKSAELLINSLRNVKSDKPVIALISRSSPTNARKRLIRAGFILHDVDPLLHMSENCREVEWLSQTSDSAFFKFRAFDLECVNRIVYLEPDSIVLKNIDSLFSTKNDAYVALKSDETSSPVTTVMVFKPSKSSLKKALDKLHAVKDLVCGDGDLAAALLGTDKGTLDKKYAVLYTDYARDDKEAAVVSFRSAKKPWLDIESNIDGVKLWWENVRQLYAKQMVVWKKDKQQTRGKIIKELQDWVRRIVLPMIGAEGRPVALLDYPAHRNTGDQAIWMGEKVLFHENGVEISFECASYLKGGYRYTSNDCDFAHLRKILGKDGIIFLHGGGNFRNYPGKNKLGYYQFFRHTVVKEFPNHQIVVLPQTINFEKEFPEVVKEVRTAIGDHKNLTLLWRDTFSQQFATEHFPSAKSIVCPDMAFMMGLLAQEGLESQHFFTPGPFPSPKYKMVWIGRVDAEKITDRQQLGSDLDASLGEKTDWNLFPKPKESEFTDRAAELLDMGLAFLAKGQVVVTDRLHGMILGTLLGRPVVAMDNNYGKLTKYHSTFLSDEPNIYWASDEPEALMMAKYLAAGQEVKTVDWVPRVAS
mmetsp:Transcript_24611/g.40526  ORF Transcript_24611/g.40526 Transcript_24611/m.40526 type:complete len:682 (+) Transcript_24611:63-2108(+)